MEVLVLMALMLLMVPLVLPIVALVRSVRMGERTHRLERDVEWLRHESARAKEQSDRLESSLVELRAELARLARGGSDRTSTVEAPVSTAYQVVPALSDTSVRATDEETAVAREPASSRGPEVPTPQPEEMPTGAVSEAETSDRRLVAGAMRRQLTSQPAADVPAGDNALPPPPEGPPPDAGSVPPAGSAGPTEARIDWERWLGVRGAAVLGGVVLALAAVLFFKYSIEHGLISPGLRVVIGTVVGLACLLGSERIHAKYGISSNAIAGAGAVTLYAAFWAAKALYNLVPMELAFALMALTTAACSLLAIRRSSLLVAVLGLVGGFSTPLLLASGNDRPIGLFGYVLLLDAGFLFVAFKRRWGIVALLSLMGTVLLQGLWIGMRMTPQSLGIGLGVLGLFAGVYAVVGARPPEGGTPNDRRLWLVSQAGAILMPFVFALYLASHSRFGAHLYPLAILMMLLGAAASWVALSSEVKAPWLAVSAASASVAVVWVWLENRNLSPNIVWEVSACAFGLALVFHVGLELERWFFDTVHSSTAAWVSGLGLLGVLTLASSNNNVATPWPWLLGWLGIAALLFRHAGFPRRERLHVITAIALGIAFAAFHSSHAGNAGFPEASYYFAAEVLVILAWQVATFFRGGEERRWAEWAGGVLPIVMLAGLLTLRDLRYETVEGFLLPSLALGLLAAIAGTRSGEGRLVCGGGAALALVHTVWTQLHRQPWDTVDARKAFAVQIGAVLFFTVWPLLAKARFKATRWGWYASALAGAAWFLPLKVLYDRAFGASTIGVLPIGLAILSLTTLIQVRTFWPVGQEVRKSALVWYSAVALGFISVAIPLQLDRQWITVGWALEGLAVTALWKRLDHPGLKWFGLMLHAAVTIRLVANPSVLHYYDRGSMRIINWLLYTYWVPAACLVGTFLTLNPREVQRARPWEKWLYSREHAVGAIGSALAAVLVVFAWINLAIADWFSVGTELVVDFERQPKKDLATSIAWAVYAIVLLAIGMARKSRGLRWVSLIFLIVTIGKVFLYDLGQLRDLYRVVSLLGLAFSLILVSLAYQRFVFRSAASKEKS